MGGKGSKGSTETIQKTQTSVASVPGESNDGINSHVKARSGVIGVGEPVILNVYQFEEQSGPQMPGLGIWHTGVEIYGTGVLRNPLLDTEFSQSIVLVREKRASRACKREGRGRHPKLFSRRALLLATARCRGTMCELSYRQFLASFKGIRIIPPQSISVCASVVVGLLVTEGIAITFRRNSVSGCAAAAFPAG